MSVLSRTLTLLLGAAVAGAGGLGAQTGVVAGLVVDNAGAPAPGANVTVKGTALSARTNAEGRFEIRGVPGQTVVLDVRLIPYQAVEIEARVGDTNLRIELTRLALSLEEVVVTGTAGGAQRREVANAVATVRVTEQVETAPILTLGQLINARAPGVQVNSPSGQVGGGERILVRGRSSLSLRITPLIYVDGVRVDNTTSCGGSCGPVGSRLNDFHPDDIEMIEIIKGPAAGTLYGTEASSGVIQILTKRGTPGPTQVRVSTRNGVNFFANPEGRWLTNYFRESSGSVVDYNLAQQETDRGTPLFRTGLLQGYSLDVSGGTESVQYFGAGHYDRDEGAIATNSAEKFGARVNLGVTPKPTWDANGQLSVSLLRNTYPNGNYVFGSLLSRPSVRDTPQRGFFTAPSEVWNRETSQREDVDHFTVGGEIRHRPRSWLNHRLRVGFDATKANTVNLTRRMTAEDAVFFSPGQAAGQKAFSQRNLLSTTLDYSASAVTSLGQSLRVTSTAGAQYYRQNLTLLSATGRTFPSPDVTSIAGAATTFGSDDNIENVTVGLFGQVQVAWKNRLFLTAAVRGDDNSAFGSDFNFVTYPKVSASWVVSDEPFWKLGPVDNLRLRAAWGESGQQPQNFAALRTYQPITGQAGSSAITPQFVGNPELGPERSSEIELGFDASLFNQRVGIDFTFYQQKTRDAIVLRNVAPSTGFPEQQFVNAGTVQNRGVELLIDGRIIESRNVAWDVGLNLSHNHNEVLELGIPSTPYLAFGFGNRFQPGFPLYGIFARKVVSADQDAQGRPINIKCDGGTEGGLPGGSPVACAGAPQVYIGPVDPTLDGGVSSSLRLWNRVTVSGLVDFKRGQRAWTSSLWCPGILGCEEEIYPERFDPVKAASSVLGLTDDAEWWRDMSFVKLREVAISVLLPTEWAGWIGASRAQASLAGRNLHTWTSFQGLDPESNSLYAEAATFGTPFEQNEVPQLRQFVFRLNLTF
ncbi:MAG: SusC/RagA family TonB-linked outer membrane protein [Gemmatimonadales bacterium]